MQFNTVDIVRFVLWHCHVLLLLLLLSHYPLTTLPLASPLQLLIVAPT